MTRSQMLDIIERAAWTAIEGASGVGIVAWLNRTGAHLDASVWVPVIAVALAMAKSSLATKFGNGSGASLPASADPVPVGTAEVTEQS